jgi:hypothetical protein
LILVGRGHIDAPINFRMMAVALDAHRARFRRPRHRAHRPPAGMQTALVVAETGA